MKNFLNCLITDVIMSIGLFVISIIVSMIYDFISEKIIKLPLDLLNTVTVVIFSMLMLAAVLIVHTKGFLLFSLF